MDDDLNSDDIIISEITWDESPWLTDDSSISKNDIFTFDNTFSINTEYEINFDPLEEWKNVFPDFKMVREMCKHYPSLEIAFTKFKEIYQIVEQDYLSKDDNN